MPGGNTHKLRRIAVGGLVLLVFLGGLGARDVTTSHEARVAQTARLMASSGWPWAARPVGGAATGVRQDRDGAYAVPRFDVPPVSVNPWLVPVLNGQVRLQKPPLPNWCAAVLYRLSGVSELATRLVPALLGAAATLLVADLARLLIGRRAALPAALVWAGTLAVVSEFREATPDPFLAFFTLSAVWAWVRAGARRDGRAAHASPPRQAALLIVAFYVSLGLGVLAKGPFVFVHVGVALLAYHVCYRRRPGARWPVHVVGAVMMLAVALPWPVYVVTRIGGVAALWEMEATRGGGGAAGAGQVLRDLWKYLPRLVELSLPWTPLWLAGVALCLRRGGSRGRRRRGWFPMLWCAGTVAVFSFGAEKKNAYLLPMMPAQVLIVTAGLLGVSAAVRRAGTRRVVWPRVAVGAQVAFGVAIVVAGGVIITGSGNRAALTTAAPVAGAAVVLLTLGAWAAHGDRLRDSRRWAPLLAAGCAVACLLTAGLARTVRENQRSAKAFAQEVGPVMRPPASALVPSLPAEAAFYLPLDLRYDPQAPEQLTVAEPPRGGAFDLDKLRTEVPHGRVVAKEVVPLPNGAAEQRWRLVRLTVQPAGPASAPAIRPASPVESPAPGGG